MSYLYRFCGLGVASEIELSNLSPVTGDPAGADVKFRRAPVALELPPPVIHGPDWSLSGDSILFKVPGIARFAMIGGRELHCELQPGVEEGHARAFLLGSAFGMLLHQRGNILLHASVVAARNRAIALCGASGAGKSTLAASLCKAGAGFLSDDICLIRIEGRTAFAQQDGRRLKLWADAIDGLELGDRHGSVRPTVDKFFVEPSARCPSPEVSLGAVYILQEDGFTDWPRIERLSLAEAAMLLRSMAYRPELVRAMGQEARYFSATAVMLGTVPVFRLTRSKTFSTMAATVQSLQEHWRELGFAP